MELTIKKDVNPNYLKIIPLGIAGVNQVTLNGEFICSYNDLKKAEMESILAMAKAYYNFLNQNIDDLKDVL